MTLRFIALALFLLPLAGCAGDTAEVTVDIEGETHTHAIETEDTLYDLLDRHHDLEVDTTEHGVMLQGVDDLSATLPGSFIHISGPDGEDVQAGIEELELEAGDYYTFSLDWYDEDAERLAAAIEELRNAGKETFVDAGDFYALMAMEHDHTDVDFDMDALAGEGVYGLAREILLADIWGEDVSERIDELETDYSFDHPYTASLQAAALAVAEGDEQLIASYLEDLEARMPLEDDLDSAAHAYLALQLIDHDTDFEEQLLDTLEANLHEHPYGNNAATYAWMTMAYVAAGRDVFGPENGESPLEALLDLQSEEGLFYFAADDDETDSQFASPQAYLALVTALRSIEEETPHPYRTGSP